MRVVLGRVLGAALPALLVFGAVGLTSQSARAGVSGAPQCGSFGAILEFYDETSVFTGFGLSPNQCSKLCKDAGGDCKEFINDTSSCVKKSINDELAVDKKTICDPIEDNSDRKDCKNSLNDSAKSDKDALKSSADSAKDSCDLIRDACISDCED